jgi:hypothetical protein
VAGTTGTVPPVPVGVPPTPVPTSAAAPTQAVLPTSSQRRPSTTPSSATAPTQQVKAASGRRQLPFTGFEPWKIGLVGMLALAGGVGLAYRARRV